jgi:hypothetical protein
MQQADTQDLRRAASTGVMSNRTPMRMPKSPGQLASPSPSPSPSQGLPRRQGAALGRSPPGTAGGARRDGRRGMLRHDDGLEEGDMDGGGGRGDDVDFFSADQAFSRFEDKMKAIAEVKESLQRVDAVVTGWVSASDTKESGTALRLTQGRVSGLMSHHLVVGGERDKTLRHLSEWFDTVKGTAAVDSHDVHGDDLATETDDADRVLFAAQEGLRFLDARLAAGERTANQVWAGGVRVWGGGWAGMARAPQSMAQAGKVGNFCGAHPLVLQSGGFTCPCTPFSVCHTSHLYGECVCVFFLSCARAYRGLSSGMPSADCGSGSSK